jgi:ABC-type multidrug transport system ATPase subunit
VNEMSVDAVAISGLHKSYRKNYRSKPRPALDGLELHIAAGGRVHGFLGPNGSGKTTTLRVLLGLVQPDAGEVRILGHRRSSSELSPAVVTSNYWPISPTSRALGSTRSLTLWA